MKGINFSFLRIVSALIIGLVLVLFPDRAGEYFIITIAVVFMIPSLISIISYLVQPAEQRNHFPVEGVGSLLLGVLLIAMSAFFSRFVTIVLGFILVMGGVQQIASLLVARRWMPVPVAFYVVPVLVLIGGLVSMINPMGVQKTAFIVIGAGSLVYAVSELINWSKFTRRRPQAPAGKEIPPQAGDDGIEDAEIVE